MRKFIFAAIATVLLNGCGVIGLQPEPNYVEPNPGDVPTARLRVVVAPGVSASVAIYKNNGEDLCLRDKEPFWLPVDINISGFPQSHTKKIGMPLADTYHGKIGTEMYIPVSKPIVIGALFSSNGGGFIQSCSSAFRFQPLANKDYQIYVIPGLGETSRKGHGCLIDIGEIPENHPADKALPSVEVQPIVVWGSPAWPLVCKSEQANP